MDKKIFLTEVEQALIIEAIDMLDSEYKGCHPRRKDLEEIIEKMVSEDEKGLV